MRVRYKNNHTFFKIQLKINLFIKHFDSCFVIISLNNILHEENLIEISKNHSLESFIFLGVVITPALLWLQGFLVLEHCKCSSIIITDMGRHMTKLSIH